MVTNPSDDFVKLVAADLVGNKRFTPAIKDQFTAITKRAFELLIGERINERLKGAMSLESAPSAKETIPPVVSSEPTNTSPPQVLTSPEEIEAFHVIRAILRNVVPTRRVFMRDAQSYCAVLLDDNNRKPICRLRFNNTEKLSVGIFNDKKEEERIPLDSVDDIYNHSDKLAAAVMAYL